ncbi:MAG: Disaggregatase related repeat protein [Bacteroidetes bacterium ADurb.Bin408]|nr:MAG: Disaggregatase related repeat protein [Bacteroidetes bacterium ADurb.Bin408]
MAWTHGGEFAIIRSVIDFDLSFIPANSAVTNALLSLYAIDNNLGEGYHYGVNNAWLERIISPWDEFTVTWNNQPATTTQNRVALAASTSPTQNYTDINITTLMQDILSNPTSGYGIMLKLQDETVYRNLNFCSSDHANPALRPKLYICYTLPDIGMNDHVPINNLNVFPIPATEVIYFKYTGANIGSMGIVVSNILGQVVMQIASESFVNELNISHLNPGLYFYNAIIDGKRFSGKFIKN